MNLSAEFNATTGFIDTILLNFNLFSIKLRLTASSPSNHGNGLWVKVTKPVWCMVKGLLLKDFKYQKHNPLTKRAS